MMRLTDARSRGVAVLLTVVILLGTVPGIAAAEQQAGGSIVIEEGETVEEDLTAFGGTVTVRGTVDGDLTAFAGNVVIESTGEVTGSVEATAGNVRIAGQIGGDATATGGNVFVASSATVGGDLVAAAGSIVVAGSVAGDAKLAGGSITLASTASIDGTVEYDTGDDGEFVNENATVGGIAQNESLSTDGGFEGPDIGAPIFGFYGLLVNLLVGALLLLVFPATSGRIAEAVEDEPLRTGGIGLLALIGVPIGLVVVAITVVGLPLSLAGILVYVLAVWIATIYGRYAVGSWLLGYADVENRWAALGVGLVAVAILVRIPLVGGLADFLVVLIGLGAMATLLYRYIKQQRDSGESEPTEGPVAA